MLSKRDRPQNVNIQGSVTYIEVDSKTYGHKSIAIDTQDVDTVLKHRWCVYTKKDRNTFYAASRIDGRVVRLHQFLLGQPGTSIDHVDRNGLNNTRENLRPATTAQNNANQPTRRNNTSGIKGVSWNKRDKKWRASITINGKHHSLGYFDRIEDAATAYKEAALQAFGEFASWGELTKYEYPVTIAA